MLSGKMRVSSNDSLMPRTMVNFAALAKKFHDINDLKGWDYSHESMVSAASRSLFRDLLLAHILAKKDVRLGKAEIENEALLEWLKKEKIGTGFSIFEIGGTLIKGGDRGEPKYYDKGTFFGSDLGIIGAQTTSIDASSRGMERWIAHDNGEQINLHNYRCFLSNKQDIGVAIRVFDPGSGLESVGMGRRMEYAYLALELAKKGRIDEAQEWMNESRKGRYEIDSLDLLGVFANALKKGGHMFAGVFSDVPGLFLDYIGLRLIFGEKNCDFKIASNACTQDAYALIQSTRKTFAILEKVEPIRRLFPKGYGLEDGTRISVNENGIIERI